MLSALALAAAITLELPLDCRPGQTCFVQQYVDHDAGPGAQDFRCGSMSYDGHDGTDFRLPTVAAQRRGVAVLAAAAGIVKAARDGMDDVPVDRVGQDAIKGRECGNGVVISHADNWETQYCHMAKGSLRVKAGDRVTAGQPLGLVGESGDAAFPHLHLSVRHGDEKIDPFAWDPKADNCKASKALWSAKAAAALVYRSPELINFGFADGPVSMEDIEAGRAEARPPGPGAEAIVAFVRAIGLRQDDVLTLELSGPGGVDSGAKPMVLDHDKAQFMLFAGRKRPATGWAKGRYRARFAVERGGQTVLERSFDLRL